MNNAVSQIGRGVTNQVNSLGNQITSNLATNAGQSAGNIAAGGLYGLGQGLGGFAAGLNSAAGMRIAGTETDSSSGETGDDNSDSNSSGRGLKQAAGWMTNPAITDFGMAAVNAAGGIGAGNNFPADFGLSGFGGLPGLDNLGIGGLAGLDGGLGGVGGLGGTLGGLAGLGGGGLGGLGGGGGLGGLGGGGLGGLGGGGLAGLGGGGLGGLGGGGLGGLGGGGIGGLGGLAGGLGGGGLLGGLGNRNPAGSGGLLGALFGGNKRPQGVSSMQASNSARGFPGQLGSTLQPSSSSSSSSTTGYKPVGQLEQGALSSTGATGSSLGSSSSTSGYNPYSSTDFAQQFGQLAQVPGQAAGAVSGYGTGLVQQGVQTAQQVGNNALQQTTTSLQTPGQPVIGGNQQPTVVQGLGQDPNTYLVGASDYYPGGQNPYGQTGGPSATYTAGQGTLTGGQLVPSTAVGGQYAGGQLGTGGGFVGQNPNPGGAFDPSTGQFVSSPPNQGGVPGGFYWTGGYWGYCPPPTPPAAQQTLAPPPPPGTTAAFIKSPTPGYVASTGPSGLAPVLLDATGSNPAPNRRIVAYGWVIKSATDGTPKATATGQTATVQLGPGIYIVTLNVVDNTGQNAVQGPVQFTVTGAGQTAPSAGGLGPNAVMVAVIKSPQPIVIAERELQGGNKSINLDASGSTPSPGHLIDSYIWTITTQQAGNMQIISNQTVKQANAAFVSLPVGSYIVTLVMIDTSGRNASITQNFVVAGGTIGGTIAVISQPLSFVPGSPGPWTTVLLDSQGSAAKVGASLTQFVWALVDRANLTADGKPTAIANATGRVAQVRLRPGLYQVGLLVLDSSGQGNAIAQKNFQVGPMAPAPPGEVPVEDIPAPAPSPSPNPADQQPPVIQPLVQPLEGETGGRVSLPVITDPNNDPVDVKWDIKLGDQVIKSGAGSVVSLQNVPPTMTDNLYTIVVTASDGRLTATGTYQLKVRKGTGPAPPPPIPPPPPPTPLAIDLRLPSLTLSQGAVLEIDAGSTGVPFRNLTDFSYRWSVKSKSTGQTITTQEGQQVSIPLDEAESLQLVLLVTEPVSNQSTTGTSNLRVFPQPEGSQLPKMTGTCPPFKSNPASDTWLGCPELKPVKADGTVVPDSDLVWAWRLTRVDNQKITTSVGKNPNFGRLSEANFIVEAAVGYQGPPTSTNTIFFLSSYLVVGPSNPPTPAPQAAAAPAPTPTTSSPKPPKPAAG